MLVEVQLPAARHSDSREVLSSLCRCPDGGVGRPRLASLLAVNWPATVGPCLLQVCLQRSAALSCMCMSMVPAAACAGRRRGHAAAGAAAAAVCLAVSTRLLGIVLRRGSDRRTLAVANVRQSLPCSLNGGRWIETPAARWPRRGRRALLLLRCTAAADRQPDPSARPGPAELARHQAPCPSARRSRQPASTAVTPAGHGRAGGGGSSGCGALRHRLLRLGGRPSSAGVRRPAAWRLRDCRTVGAGAQLAELHFQQCGACGGALAAAPLCAAVCGGGGCAGAAPGSCCVCIPLCMWRTAPPPVC